MNTVQVDKTPDLTDMVMQAYELSDMIKRSDVMARYLQWKRAMEQDPRTIELMKEFRVKKERFEECQRFGHFHPDYHEAMNEVYKVQEKLDEIDCVKQYKAAEKELDEILHKVAETLARAVSEEIKVPSNDPLPAAGGCGSGGCGSGGSCNCG